MYMLESMESRAMNSLAPGMNITPYLYVRASAIAGKLVGYDGSL